MQRDPVLRLPSELVTACIGWLDFKSRIAASHVSWSWRNVALSDRSLWNEYTIPDWTGFRDWQGGLAAMLDRSYPVPFRFSCSTDLPEALVQLLVRHMRRIRLLRLNNIQLVTVQRLIAEDAPMLEVFSFYWYLDPAIHFTLTCAPCLRDVRLGRFVWASNSAFGAMRSFSGTLLGEHSLPQPLLHLFPNLTEIYLHGVTQACLVLLSPLQRSMTSVTLFSARDEPIDYASFFRGCETARLSNLSVNLAASISPAVQYFMHSVPRPWELHLGMQTDVRLCGPDVSHTIHLHRRLSLAQEPELPSLLHHISELSLPITDYVDLYQSPAWAPRTLPELTQLTLDVRVRDRSPEITPSDFETTPPIAAPALESVSFRVFGNERSTPRAIPQIPPVIHSLPCAQLANIVVLATFPRYLETADMSYLAGLARTVSVGRMDGFVVVPREL